MIELRSMAVTMPEVAGHPNRAEFRGVLTTVDVPSHRAPSGSRGHLVMLTRKAAEAALPSLLGMALDYSPSLDRHDVRLKVGVITRAEIVGQELELGGYLFARDFPEIVQEIANSKTSERRHSPDRTHSADARNKTVNASVVPRVPDTWAERCGLRGSLQAVVRQLLSLTKVVSSDFHPAGFSSAMAAESCIASGFAGLGLSYEITGVQVADTRERIWRLDQVTFTGAAILRRDKAAYRDTWIELVSS